MFSVSSKHSSDKEPTLDRSYRRKRILRRFRALVHLVMANLYWIGDVDNLKISDNVKRNIRLLMRRKQGQSPLSTTEKAILNKPKELRTDAENRILIKRISGLKCFRKYDLTLKENLAMITYFAYFSPHRVIVKQGHKSHAMYFILMGECGISIKHYNKVLGEIVTEDVGVLGPGDMFGEVALLHGISRLATVTTLTHCEFLMIKKDDFDEVLKETVTKSWSEIQKTLNRFSYFKNWDDVTRREFCIICKTKYFEAGETILGDGVGSNKDVYFVIDGICTIIEALTVNVYNKKGSTKYRREPVGDMELKVSEDRLTGIFHKYWTDDDAESYFTGQSSDISTIKTDTSTISNWKKQISDAKNSLSYVTSQKKKAAAAATMSRKTQKKRSSVAINFPSNNNLANNEKIVQSTSILDVLGAYRRSSTLKSFKSLLSGLGLQYEVVKNYKTETHFFELCQLQPGACFNVGEKFERRRIITQTPVTCLVVPQYFIFKNNYDNVWSMVKQFLDQHIPDTKEIFNRFVQEQKFKQYKKNLVRHLLEEKMVGTNNSIHNVPYTIRLRDGVDANYF